jgi:BirA family biotin operon repressor/biotin-[acetyl-CoA-carboxylase] ligase
VELSTDLSAHALAEALPGRPVRSYPAMLSTEADALAWARAGADDGAVVVAGYQAAPRGRAGRLWPVDPGGDLAFSMVLRPRLAAAREGWLYTVATSALADACDEDASIAWPDEVRRDGALAAAVGVQVEPAPPRLAWAVVSVLVAGARPPRDRLLARIVGAIEAAGGATASDLLAGYTPRCETLGRRVCARLVPMGPNGERVTGTAVTALKDGALLIETDEGRRVAVPPQSLGVLEVEEV